MSYVSRIEGTNTVIDFLGVAKCCAVVTCARIADVLSRDRCCLGRDGGRALKQETEKQEILPMTVISNNR